MENTVKGVSPTQTYGSWGRVFPPKGIRYRNTTGNFSCNIVDSVYIGFEFREDCDNSDWGKNKIRNHTTGLKLGSLAELKEQYWKGNSFKGTCLTEAESSQTGRHTIFYYSNGSADYVPFPVFSSSNASWWVNLSKSGIPENDVCGTSIFGGEGIGFPFGGLGDRLIDMVGLFNPVDRFHQPIFGIELTSTDTAILSNTMVFGSFEQEMTWQFRQDVYDRLKPFENDFRDTSIFREYISQIEDGTINEFTEMNIIELDAYEAALAYSEQLSTLVSDIDSGWRELRIIDSSIYANQDSNQIASLQSNRTNLIDWMADRDSNLQILIAGANEVLENNLEELLDINDTLNHEGAADSLQILFNAIYYQTYGAGNADITASQYQTYESLAGNCPYLNLDIVHRSRAIVWSKNDTIRYDDSVICAPHGILVKSVKPLVYTKRPKSKIEYTVYPNPTKDVFRIAITEIPEKTLTIRISDILGREVYLDKGFENTNRHSVDAKTWQNGIYLLRISDGKNDIFTKQIQVIK